MVPDVNLKEEIILSQPRKSVLADPLLITASDNDVVRYHNGPIQLETAVQSVKSHQPLFKTVGDKALAIDNVDDWITWKKNNDFHIPMLHHINNMFDNTFHTLDTGI